MKLSTRSVLAIPINKWIENNHAIAILSPSYSNTRVIETKTNSSIKHDCSGQPALEEVIVGIKCGARPPSDLQMTEVMWRWKDRLVWWWRNKRINLAHAKGSVTSTGTVNSPQRGSYRGLDLFLRPPPTPSPRYSIGLVSVECFGKY